MPFTLRKLPDAPIILFSQKSSDALAELPDMLAGISEMLDAQDCPVFLIFDTRAVQIDLDGLIQSASAMARGSQAMAHHPMLRESLVVTTSRMLRVAALGARSPTFGSARVSVFDTPEQALEYCARQLGVAARELRRAV